MLIKVFLLFFLCSGIHIKLRGCVIHFAIIEVGRLLSYPLRYARKVDNSGVVHVAPVAFASEQKSHSAVTICSTNKKAAFHFFLVNSKAKQL